MRTDSYISNLDDLQEWFDLNQKSKETKPYFTIWRGTEPQPNRIIARNEEISEPDESWKLLQNIIEMHSGGGGTFRVYLTTKPGFNVGMSTIVRIPGPANNLAGIQGVAGGGIFGFPENLEREIERRAEERFEMKMLRQEIDDLKSGNAAISGIEQFKQLMEYPAFNNLVQMLGMKVMGIQPAQPGQRPIPGSPAPAEAIHGSDAHEGYDYDVVEPALDKMRRVFPDVEMTLDKLAEWIVKNPDQAKMIFGNLNQPGT